VADTTLAVLWLGKYLPLFSSILVNNIIVNYYEMIALCLLHVSFWNEMVQSTPANCPILIGIVPIFEFQNRKKLGHSDFQEEKKKIFFCKNLELGC